MNSHSIIWAVAIVIGTVAAAFGYALTDAEQQSLVEAGGVIAVAIGGILSTVKAVRDRKAPPALVLLVLLPMVGLSGCQGKEVSTALKTYTFTVDKLNAAYDAGQITPETQVKVISPARLAAKAILDEMTDAYVKGTPYDWRAALNRFYVSIEPLLRQRELLEATDAH